MRAIIKGAGAAALLFGALVLFSCAKESGESAGKPAQEQISTETYGQTNESHNEIPDKGTGVEKMMAELEHTARTENLLDMKFKGDIMYLLSEKNGNIALASYNMDTGEKKETEVEKENGKDRDAGWEMEAGDGVIAVYKTIYDESISIYIYNDRLEYKRACRDLKCRAEGCFVSGEDIYYYNHYTEEILDHRLYRLDAAGEKHPVVDFDTVRYGGKSVMPDDICMSDDGRYIFWAGNIAGDDGGKSESGWGYISLENPEEGVVNRGRRRLYRTSKGVIVTAENENNMMGAPILTKEYSYFHDGMTEEQRELKNEEESPIYDISCDGNVMITYCLSDEGKQNTIRVYDVNTGDIIYEKTGKSEEVYWSALSEICEKYNTVIWEQYEYDETGGIDRESAEIKHVDY